MAGCTQPSPGVNVEEERPCVPSCCQDAETLLPPTFTWLEQFRKGQGRKGSGEEGQEEEVEAQQWLGSYA